MYNRYYSILGIPENSNAAAIKKAYRKLAMEYHPDVSQLENSRERFIEITKAYEVLMDRLNRPILPTYSVERRRQMYRRYAEQRAKKQGKPEERAKKYAEMKYKEFKRAQVPSHPYPTLEKIMISIACLIYLMPFIGIMATGNVLAGLIVFLVVTAGIAAAIGIFYLINRWFNES